MPDNIYYYYSSPIQFARHGSTITSCADGGTRISPGQVMTSESFLLAVPDCNVRCLDTNTSISNDFNCFLFFVICRLSVAGLGAQAKTYDPRERVTCYGGCSGQKDEDNCRSRQPWGKCVAGAYGIRNILDNFE